MSSIVHWCYLPYAVGCPLPGTWQAWAIIEAGTLNVTDASNPWLPTPPRPADEPSAPAPVATTGPVRPQRGVPAPDRVDQLPSRQVERAPALWILGAHGGAGESTISDLDDDWSDGGHAWPAVKSGEPVRVLVVARTNARGLIAAKSAAKQWAAGLVDGVEVLGLVLVADAPGRLPRPLRELAKVVAGGYPRTWSLPWLESWRLGEHVSAEADARPVRRLVDDLRKLLTSGAAPAPQPERN